MKKKTAEIIRESGICEETVLKYHKLIRSVCLRRFDEEEVLLGGPDLEIEIDESHLFKFKYNTGRILAFQNVWCLGCLKGVVKKYLLSVLRTEIQTACSMYYLNMFVKIV
jgi:hypothetical protein